ncbi:hypothetical protein BH10BAC2_BH10BAC2_40600 [soil metagenome]
MLFTGYDYKVQICCLKVQTNIFLFFCLDTKEPKSQARKDIQPFSRIRLN